MFQILSGLVRRWIAYTGLNWIVQSKIFFKRILINLFPHSSLGYSPVPVVLKQSDERQLGFILGIVLGTLYIGFFFFFSICTVAGYVMKNSIFVLFNQITILIISQIYLKIFYQCPIPLFICLFFVCFFLVMASILFFVFTQPICEIFDSSVFYKLFRCSHLLQHFSYLSGHFLCLISDWLKFPLIPS